MYPLRCQHLHRQLLVHALQPLPHPRVRLLVDHLVVQMRYNLLTILSKWYLRRVLCNGAPSCDNHCQLVQPC